MADADTDEKAAAAAKAESLRKWKNELEQAAKRFKDFHLQAERAVRRYLDDIADAGDNLRMAPKRLGLFHSNVNVLRANLFGQIPEAEADRRFFDPKDDDARVAAEMMTRVINNDLNDPQDQGNEALKAALQDKLVAGLGIVRYRYMLEEEQDPSVTVDSLAAQFPDGVPKDYEVPMVKKYEGCEAVYTYWKDILWGPCRVWGPDWVGFRSYMTKEEVAKRFNSRVAGVISYGTQRDSSQPSPSVFSQYDENKRVTPEAEIWEIWDRTTKKVRWIANGYDQFLDEKDDLLELPGFFPTPRPLIANATTSKFIPKPSHEINRGLYDAIDELETRCFFLTRACKAVGVYDSANSALKRIFQESVENELIPHENWAMFTERGGLKGAVDWIPIEANANALKICTEQQLQKIEQLYQVEGLSDIIRGQASQPATAAEQKIKAQFASVKLQFLQDEFAEYVSDLMNIKVSIVRSLYDEQRIVKLSNAQAMPAEDVARIPAALKLIKSTDFNLRVVIKAESLIQKNMQAIKGERTELLQGIAQFIGMAQQMIQTNQDAAPFVFQLLQFGISAFDGASEMEGIFDAYIEKMEEAVAQAKANPPPPPAVVEAQAKGQVQMQVEQAKAAGVAQAEQVRGQTEVAIEQARGQTQVAIKDAEGKIEISVEAQKAEINKQVELARIAADERQKEADRQLEREKIAAEDARAAAELASKERIAAADRASKEMLEREKIASQERTAEKQAQAAKESKQKEIGE